MPSALFLKRLISFFALLISLVSFSFALAVDSDGDGVDDIQDAFPEDASKQYLLIDEALSKIKDPNLRSCLTDQTQGHQTAGELIETGCPGNNVQSLEGLQHFTELEIIWGDEPNYDDLTPLQNLVDLRYLRLNHPQGTRISDAAPLSSLTELVELGLSGSNVGEFGFLSQLQQLQSLDLNNTRLSSITSLGNLPSLKRLYIHGTLVRELVGIENFTTLEYLDIQSLQLTSIDILFANSNLVSLYAGNNNLSSVDLGEGVLLLKDLALYGNSELRELKNFAGRSFDYVDVRWTAFESLGFIADQTEINRLYIGGEQLNDLDGLVNVTGISHLEIQDTPSISDLNVLGALHSLSLSSS